jgi:UDP-N-acetylglucosamine--N-acetylmuramyl-(pentapeptide) pyrophosphoryl-undecaprenol N-acetylglucosamine transferase
MLIAGGGTGGHLFPGIAVAEEVTTRHPKNEVVFVGTRRGLEARVVPECGYKLEVIAARGLKGMGPVRFLVGLLALPVSFVESWRILKKYRPDVVVGVGGYASGPVVLAAWMQGVPTAVQEQNALPGFTNRVLGNLVTVVFVAFTESRKYFPAKKVQLIGNPIRRMLLDNYLRSRKAHDRFTVLVFGGSQGARGINDRVVEALDELAELKNELHFIHQTGAKDLDRVRQEYARRGFSAEVVPFIVDMSSAYSQAEVVICRAGAATLAELTVCKKASILIPFPAAADNHQEVNAQAMVAGGAALMFRESELTGKRLADQVRSLKGDPGALKKMERQAALLGRPEASKELADVCVQMMVDAWGPHGRDRPDKKRRVPA